MRILCGDHDPPLRNSTSQSYLPENDGPDVFCTNPNHVHLSWARIANSPGMLEVVSDISDPYYGLYTDCLSYLRTQYPVQSLTCSLPNDIIDQPGLGHLHPSFGTLVNGLADRYPRPDLDNLPPEGLSVTFRRNSVLDFVISGMLAVVVTLKHHIACGLRESPREITESDLYQALFLDCITSLWSYECYLRAGTAEWSPMPWSRSSLRELSSDALNPDPATVTASLSTGDLAEEHSSAVRTARAFAGSPMDIPWFGAHHDGHPFCGTLASYTKIRRESKLQSLRDDAALWVSALSFGLLEAVTRARIPESILVVPGSNDGEVVISGTRILQLVVRWHQRMHRRGEHTHEDEDAHLEHGREVALLLGRALNALDEEEWQNASMFFRAGYRTDQVTDMVCALALTIVPLCAIAHSTWDALPEFDHLMERARDKMRNLYTATLGSCEKRMYGAGWCPNTISHQFMSTLRGIPVVSNLVRLPPYIRSSPDEHNNCTETACVFYTIPETDNYVPRHVDSSCDCKYVKPRIGDVVDLLSSGRVPAVVYDGKELCVLAAEECPYIAISHVWADGMGSVTEDGLPSCVVQRIASLAQQLLPESGAFWMDSLCVPDVRGLRKEAIKLMARTYREAAKVLVIDDCIRSQCHSEGKTWEENLFRIATSGWMRRVWTLQEGLLARELYFEFLDGPVNVAERLGLSPYDSSGVATAAASNDSLEFLSPYSCSSHVPVLAYRSDHHSCDHYLDLDDVVRLLRLRSTTKPEDELIAVSTLLPINVDALLAITGPDLAQRRVREFFIQQQQVSKELPTQLTLRLALPGFTWAPRTLVSSIEGASLKSGTGTCTEEGLTAEYFVAMFEEPVPIPQESRKVPDGELRILISHRASMATYMLRLYIGLGCTSSIPALDALLFLQGDLAGTPRSTLACAAVCISGERGSSLGNVMDATDKEVVAGKAQEATDGVTQGPPQAYTYIAPGRLRRMAEVTVLLV